MPRYYLYMCGAFLLRLSSAKAMLTSMINISVKSLLIITATVTFVANAGLYKGLDDEGNVVYSDTPFDDAEKMTLPPLTVVDAPKVKAKEEVISEDQPAETKYTRLTILSPKNDQVIWNEPALTVALQLKPALNTAQGHNTWLIMDGKPLVKNSTSLSLQIGRADRGTHTLQAQVRNKKGSILKRSQTITVHIKNTVISR